MDGSNRVTKRNRQFLRKLATYKCDVDEFQSTPSIPTSVATEWIPTHDPVEDNVTPDPTLYSKHDSTPTVQPAVSPIVSEVGSPDCLASESPAMSKSSDVPVTVVPSQVTDTPSLSLRPRIKEKWIVNPKFTTMHDQSSHD